jgi:hypothetical protein
MNRRAFFAAVGSGAALPAVGYDPQVLAALRHEEFTRVKLAAELGRQIVEAMKVWYV